MHELTREAVQAARSALGSDPVKIMLDVNCPWTVEHACAIATSLQDTDLMWLEEPVWPPEDCTGLARVRRCGVPIAAGENVAGVHGFQSLIRAGAIDFAQPSVTKIGGIGEVVKVIDACAATSVTVAPHSPYFGPGLLATMHICAARVPDPIVEVLWLDMVANPFDPWVRTENGRLRLPPGPGLGCTPDAAVLARYRVGAVGRVSLRGTA